MSSQYYILKDNGEPVGVSFKQFLTMELDPFTPRKRVALDKVGESEISTVFLFVDHNYRDPDGPPVLWETMVFGGPMNSVQDRCSGSREQALAMHERMVRRVREACDTSQFETSDPSADA